MKKSEVIKNIKSWTSIIRDVDYEKNIIDIDEFGGSPYIGIKEGMQAVMHSLKTFDSLNLEDAPMPYLKNYATTVQILMNALSSAMQNVKHPQQGMPTPEVSSQTIVEAVYNYLPVAHLLFTALQVSAPDSSESLKSRLEKIEFDAKEKLNAISHLAQTAGITKYGQYFSETSEEEKSTAKGWLAAIIINIIIIITLAVSFICLQQNGTLTNFDSIQLLVTKLIVFSVLFLFLALSIKTYKAHKHNQIVNKHRKNALLTYDSLVKAETDKDTRNKILLAVTETIFGKTSTGFNTPNSDDGILISKVLDIVNKKS